MQQRCFHTRHHAHHTIKRIYIINDDGAIFGCVVLTLRVCMWRIEATSVTEH